MIHTTFVILYKRKGTFPSVGLIGCLSRLILSAEKKRQKKKTKKLEIEGEKCNKMRDVSMLKGFVCFVCTTNFCFCSCFANWNMGRFIVTFLKFILLLRRYRNKAGFREKWTRRIGEMFNYHTCFLPLCHKHAHKKHAKEKFKTEFRWLFIWYLMFNACITLESNISYL